MIRGVQGSEPGRRRFNWWELTVLRKIFTADSLDLRGFLTTS
jgi:hypothetical protein